MDAESAHAGLTQLNGFIHAWTQEHMLDLADGVIAFAGGFGTS